ncbi:MAG: hypothetical protein OSB41_12005 [Kiritimatiellae bacterium]|nr:hypothetical protein [Kiritimatiellia bacterium]
MSKTFMKQISLIAVACLWISAADAADDAAPTKGRPAVGVKIGTLGVAGEVTIPLTERINLRGVANYLEFTTDKKIDDIDYDLDLAFSSFGGYLDVHPFGNNFRVSGGVLSNGNEIDLDATPTGAVTIGNRVYPGGLIGTVSGLIEFDEVAPYLGIGFGNATIGDGAWSFSFDLGVLFQSYDVTLTADGPAAGIPGFSDDLAAEEEDIQDDLDGLEVYPVLAFGMAYRF